jgi:hypothetical protein
LDNPNSILSNQIASQKIISTTTITISTNPANPLSGGGTDNIAFLLGSDNNAPLPSRPNAQALQMTAVSKPLSKLLRCRSSIRAIRPC